MRTFTSYIEFKCKVEFPVDGENRPATQTDPEERAEIELISVRIGDTDIKLELTEEQLAVLDEECWAELEECDE